MKRLIALLVLCTPWLTGCQKGGGAVTFDPDFKDYFMPGKKGSYWLYESRPNHKRDSIWIETYTAATPGQVNIYYKSSRGHSAYSSMTYADDRSSQYHINFDNSAEIWLLLQGKTYTTKSYDGEVMVSNAQIGGKPYTDVLYAAQSPLMTQWYARKSGLIQFVRSDEPGDTFLLKDFRLAE